MELYQKKLFKKRGDTGIFFSPVEGRIGGIGERWFSQRDRAFCEDNTG